jgi:2-dehydro-3-deoxygalactonokinase
MNPTDHLAQPSLLGIDWGTSNRRAWWLGSQGQVLAEHSDDQGLLAAQGRFAESLQALLQAGPALPPGCPTLMAGMVGAATGWQEAPYMDAAQPLAQLAGHLQAVAAAGPRCFIVPGVCFSAPDGTVDVMRGEETQLLGALALGHGDGWYVLPGTHSKWVRLAGGRVADLATYMTGELFALLTQHGTLSSVTRPTAATPGATPAAAQATIGAASSAPAPLQGSALAPSGGPSLDQSHTQAHAQDHGQGHAQDQAQAFSRGVAAAARSGLSNALFGCRAQVVAGRMPAGQAREYLSGLLIGAEWHDVVRRAGHVPGRVSLIGSPELAQRYASVAQAAGCRIDCLDPRNVQLAAFGALRAHL